MKYGDHFIIAKNHSEIGQNLARIFQVRFQGNSLALIGETCF